MVSLLIDVPEFVPRPLLWAIVLVLLPFAVVADCLYYIWNKGWLWILGAFFFGFLIAIFVSSASQGEPGALTVARKRSIIFILLQKSVGRDAVWLVISSIRVWKNVLQTGANFFLWQVWALEGIEKALLY